EEATKELRVLRQVTEAGQSACVHLVERLLLSGQHDFPRLELRTREALNPFPVRLGARARLRFREGLRFLRADLGEYPFPLCLCPRGPKPRPEDGEGHSHRNEPFLTCRYCHVGFTPPLLVSRQRAGTTPRSHDRT